MLENGEEFWIVGEVKSGERKARVLPDVEILEV